MFGILLWQDWGDKPLADLPPFYWVVYALFLCILIAMILVDGRILAPCVQR